MLYISLCFTVMFEYLSDLSTCLSHYSDFRTINNFLVHGLWEEKCWGVRILIWMGVSRVPIYCYVFNKWYFFLKEAYAIVMFTSSCSNDDISIKCWLFATNSSCTASWALFIGTKIVPLTRSHFAAVTIQRSVSFHVKYFVFFPFILPFCSLDLQ